MDVDGLLCTEERGHPGSPSSFTKESHPQLPQLGQMDTAEHWYIQSCTMPFPHLIIFIINVPGSKGISSEIAITKLNFASYRQVVSKAEFCFQMNHSNRG